MGDAFGEPMVAGKGLENRRKSVMRISFSSSSFFLYDGFELLMLIRSNNWFPR